MTHSKIHKRFSERLNNPDVLTNPEKYLGPNYKDVLNFWIYVDTLSDQEMREFDALFMSLDVKLWYSYFYVIEDMAINLIDVRSRCCWRSVYDITQFRIFSDATLELIVSHKLLEDGKTPLALYFCVPQFKTNQ